MKYVKYVVSLIIVLGAVVLGTSTIKGAEVPTGVNSVERTVNSWEEVTVLNNQLIVKSNRFYIADTYKYFLFDLKSFVGSNPGGSLGASQGIYFYTSVSSTTSTNSIKFYDLDFDNFIDMTDYSSRWIEFRLVFTLQGSDTVAKILASINNNPNYALSILAISGSGVIIEDNLYNYLKDYVDSIVSGRVDNAYQNGYDTAKNEYGYDDNGTIISGNNAYDKGYRKGTQDSGDLKVKIIDFVPGVLGSIFMFFFQIGQIGILGITILDVLGLLVLISGLIFVIKFFF